MRMTAKKYREQVYRMRSHPNKPSAGFRDARDSFTAVYASVIPFAALEYFSEVSFSALASGLVFPIGFLLFWAFYYTFYRPGFLENRLSSPTAVDFYGMPILLLGFLIWFLKGTLKEIYRLFLPKPKVAKVVIRQKLNRPTPPPLLAPELVHALHTLGLKPGCSWKQIHSQYRSLAKQTHPDLNPDITDFGNRFMKVDEAYHRLGKVRDKHFPDKL
jgi:hypothetical protein